jgi:hypothetical protein
VAAASLDDIGTFRQAPGDLFPCPPRNRLPTL